MYKGVFGGIVGVGLGRKETTEEPLERFGKGLSKATASGSRKKRTNSSHNREVLLLYPGFLIGC